MPYYTSRRRCRAAEWHILLNKFHTKINELNRQNAPSPLTRFAIGALFFCLIVSIIKFIFMVAFLFLQSYPPFLFFALYSAHFRALLFHLRKYSLLLLSAKIAPFLYLQFFPFGCGYRCIEKTESKRKKNSCLYTNCCFSEQQFFLFLVDFRSDTCFLK